MSGLSRWLVWLAALAFVLAIITTFTGPIAAVTPEGFSRACSNLALIAIAMMLGEGRGSQVA